MYLFYEKIRIFREVENRDFSFGPMTAELVFGKEIALLKTQYDAACKKKQEKEGELIECEAAINRYALMGENSEERDLYEEWKKYLRMRPSDSCYESARKHLLSHPLTRQYIELIDCLKKLEDTKTELQDTMRVKMFEDIKNK